MVAFEATLRLKLPILCLEVKVLRNQTRAELEGAGDTKKLMQPAEN